VWNLVWVRAADSADLSAFWDDLLELHGFESRSMKSRRSSLEIYAKYGSRMATPQQKNTRKYCGSFAKNGKEIAGSTAAKASSRCIASSMIIPRLRLTPCRVCGEDWRVKQKKSLKISWKYRLTIGCLYRGYYGTPPSDY